MSINIGILNIGMDKEDVVHIYYGIFSSVQSLRCVWLFVTPMDCSMPGYPAHHQLLELAQTHVHWVSDASQPSHLLSSPSPPAFYLFQHQGLFQCFTIYLFTWMCWVLVVAGGICQGIKPKPPALGVWSPSHWTTREVPGIGWLLSDVIPYLFASPFIFITAHFYFYF